MWVVWLTIGSVALTVIWTVLPLLRHEAWWIRVFDFPRVQLSICLGLVIIAFVWFVGWRGWLNTTALALLGVCLAYQLACILPYTALWPKQLRPADGGRTEDDLSILSANVLAPNRNSDGLLALVCETGPDVLLAIETDAWWDAKLDVLEADYPYSVKQPLDNLYGMHLFSRLPLLETKIEFLVEDDKPSIHAKVQLRSGQVVSLHCLHPAPPAPNENNTSQERDAELIIVAKSIAACNQPAIAVGDLNDVAWSATTRLFQKVSGLLDPRIGRGMFNTFHAKYPLLRWPLDHVFCSADFTLVTLRRLGAFGSDHFPIYAVLRHTLLAEEQHTVPRAKDHDLDWAEDKINNVDEIQRPRLI